MDTDARPPAPVSGAIDACRRCRALAESLDGETYARADAAHASIGDHLRHALEYLQCALDGIAAGTIDYDARARDPELASRRPAALAAADALEQRLRALGAELDRRVVVHETVAPSQAAPAMTSTAARELGFVATHAVHHVEIACRVAELRGIALPAELGLACSTATHLGRDAATGSS